MMAGIFGGIFLNRRDFAESKSDMNRQFGEVNKRLDRVDDRLGSIDRDLRNYAKLEGRVEELSRR